MAENSSNYLILGATGGIGSELCQILADKGASLLLAGRNGENLSKLAERLRDNNSATIETATCDATKSDQVEQLFAKAGELFDRIDGVVNLAGSIILKPIHLTSDEEFEETLDRNLRTAFNVLRFGCKAMLNSGGSIVLMSTVAAKIGLVNHEAIAAAKGGINGLVISAAATYAPRKIRVNAVAPGLVRTPLADKITSNELALKASTAMHPLGRIGEPSDIATPIAWLLDPASSWVTGQIVSVDGVMSTVRAK